MLRGLITGQLDILVTVENKTLSTDGRSGETNIITWSTLLQIYAKRIWKGGDEKFEADQEVGMTVLNLITRYNSQIDNTMRLFMGQETTRYYIRNVNGSYREGNLSITAESRDNT